MVIIGWRKRCSKCHRATITDGRRSICDECLGLQKNVVMRCDVKSWCEQKECDGNLPCKYGKREVILAEVSLMSIEVQEEIFGKVINIKK